MTQSAQGSNVFRILSQAALEFVDSLSHLSPPLESQTRQPMPQCAVGIQRGEVASESIELIGLARQEIYAPLLKKNFRSGREPRASSFDRPFRAVEISQDGQ